MYQWPPSPLSSPSTDAAAGSSPEPHDHVRSRGTDAQDFFSPYTLDTTPTAGTTTTTTVTNSVNVPSATAIASNRRTLTSPNLSSQLPTSPWAGGGTRRESAIGGSGVLGGSMMSRSTGGGGPPTPAFVRAYASFHSGRAGKKRFYNSDSADILDLRSVLGAPDSLTRASRSPLATPNGTVFRTSGRVDQASKIADFLFLGSVNDAQDPVQLARNHIRYIINVSNEEYWTVDKNVVVYPFRIDDTMNANITPLFKATRTIIERVRREHYEAKVAGSDSPPCVLVHCQKGISRSPTIVMAYLIYRNGWSLSEAMQHVTRRRPIVEPNLGFMDALKQFQESIEPAERSRRYAQLSVVLKNVSTRCPVATIREFFESKVGMVRDVTMHTRPQSGPSAQAAVAAAQAAALAQQQKDGRTGEPLALIKAPPEETSLCMVFFVCAESVPTAKEYAASHCKEMEVMAEASTGKEVRLIVPSNIKAVTRPSRRKKKPSGASPNGSPPRRASRSPNRTPRQYSVGDSNEQAELSRTQSRDSDASPYWPV